MRKVESTIQSALTQYGIWSARKGRAVYKLSLSGCKACLCLRMPGWILSDRYTLSVIIPIDGFLFFQPCSTSEVVRLIIIMLLLNTTITKLPFMQYYTASRAISAHGLMQLRGRSISTLGLHLPLATRPAPAAATATNNGSINSLRRTTTSGIILPCARRRTTRRPFSSSSSKIAAQYNRFGGRSGGGGGGGGSLFETLLSRARTYHFVIIGALIGATYTYNSDTVEVCIIHKKSSTFLFLSSHYYMYMLASS